ncbi:hypothetical protein SCHPADRAFT_382424 [Schizopora paradoxa]|uniref:Uncharacterized protein n=1 Tax=Schizopora paradoxa TaxID=27342 RepID=A0A0H2RMA6_9AGAM|nr:hypothetical protein SCHPADRAFT_382424 [Schizopora paradoxa]
MNVSIDDSSPDPLIYESLNLTDSNVNGWNVGQNCGFGCSAHPDPLQVYEGTWHDASTIENGVNSPIASTSFADKSRLCDRHNCRQYAGDEFVLEQHEDVFQVDDTIQGTYYHAVSIATDITYTYNTTLFAKEDLSDELHNIMIISGLLARQNHIYYWFRRRKCSNISRGKRYKLPFRAIIGSSTSIPNPSAHVSSATSFKQSRRSTSQSYAHKCVS